ncbi:hypothetical protein JCM10450v2_008280 [Rhodotorula kratochvilovae]
MAAFARALPQLASHAARPQLAPALRAAFHPLPATAPSSSARLFSSSARAHFAPPPHPRQPSSAFDALRGAWRKAGAGGAKRGVATSPFGAYSGGAGAKQSVDWSKVGINVGVGIAGAIGLNLALNRETSPIHAHEWEYLRQTFAYTGVGLAITAGTAFLAFKNGFTYRLMALNPWVVMGGSLVLSIGSMYGVYATAPESPAHYLSWGVFSAMQGLTLSPMFFIAPAILGRAGLYTAGAVGGISYVGATAKSDEYMWLGGPLLAGLGVLICSSLAPMLMPNMALRTLTVLESVGAYGGVAIFSGMLLYDTNKIKRHAHMVKTGVIPHDPIRESVGMILSVINLFTSIVRVMLLQQGGRRK